MFANCQMGGVSMAGPDVCKTPIGNSTPPIPYPNIAQGSTANPATIVQRVLISGMPAHNLRTVVPMSQGDAPGVCGGVMSGCNMGPRKHLSGASNILVGGSPVTKMTDPTGQNGTSMNTTGSTISPAQTKVMIMSGGSSSAGSSNSSNSESEETFDEKIQVTCSVTGKPIADYPFFVTKQNGETLSGRTDKDGHLPRIETENEQSLDVVFGDEALHMMDEE